MNSTNRYQRQLQLKEIGHFGQDKIAKAKVLIVGVGGLGCPALQYLAAAGVGTIGIVDYDKVELSNLQRQILFTMDDIGFSKVSAAAQKILASNPEINIETHEVQITNKNAIEIVDNYDIVIDGSDNFATRYLINDACALLNKPLIYGAVLRFEGQVGVFNFLDTETNIKTSYRDVFPKPPTSSSTFSCNEVGVLGVIPGIIGTMQATEALKIITGAGKPLVNKIISYNALENTFYDFEVVASENLNLDFPKTETEFKAYNYEWFCVPIFDLQTLSIEEFETICKQDKIIIIDVREINELPAINDFISIQIPMSKFQERILDISSDDKIVFICKSGKRSAKAVQLLKEKNPNSQAYSLKGGIENWLNKK